MISSRLVRAKGLQLALLRASHAGGALEIRELKRNPLKNSKILEFGMFSKYGSIRRGFSTISTEVSEKRKTPEGNPKKEEVIEKRHEYDVEDSLEYFTFLLFDPLKSEIFLNRLSKVFMNCREETREQVMKQARIMIKLRVAYHELAHSVWQETKGSLEAKVSIDQRKMMIREFTKFADSLATASLELSPSECNNLFVNLCLVRMSIHPLWVTLVPSILRNISVLTFEELEDFIRCLRMIANNYNMIEGKVRFHQNFMSLHEGYLRDVIAFSQMTNMVENMTLRINERPIIEQLDTHYKFLLLMTKYVKLSGVSSPHKKLYLDRLLSKIYQMKSVFDTLPIQDIKLIFNLSKLIISQGRNNKLAIEILRETEILLLKSNKYDNWQIILLAMSARNTFGDFDKELFQLVEAPLIQKRLANMDEKLPLRDTLHILWTVYSINPNNEKLHEQLIDHFPTAEVLFGESTGDLFQRKSLHQLLSYGITRDIIPVSQLHRIRSLSNQLSAACICSQHSIKFDRLMTDGMLASIEDECTDDQKAGRGFLECTDDRKSSDIVLREYQEKDNQIQQFYQDNYNELVIKEAMRKYLPIYLEAGLEFRDDVESIQACSYKWDAIILVEGVSQTIGFEITGQAYSSDFSGYQLKKKFKFDLLSKKNYIPVIVAVGHSKTKSYILANDLQSLGIEIINELRCQVKEYTGIELKIREEKKEDYYELLRKYKESSVQSLGNAAQKTEFKKYKITPAPKHQKNDLTSSHNHN